MELVELLISLRQDARKNKNYALADELRNKLTAIGIVLQDTPQGVKWTKQ
jgi:cysteinyl-tRNA synthetase